MSEPRGRFDNLEAELRALGELVSWPVTRDLVGGVERRIAREPARRSRANLSKSFWAAAAIVLAVIVATLAVPSARDTAGRWLGIPAIRIEVGDATEPPSSPSPDPLASLGERYPADTGADFGFTVMAPQDGPLSSPVALYWRTLVDGQPVVTLVYAPGEQLPAAGGYDFGALLMQLPEPNSAIGMVKSVDTNGTLEVIERGPITYYWISGVSAFEILGEQGSARGSANVLIWEEGGVGYRMESGLARDEAIAAVERLAPR